MRFSLAHVREWAAVVNPPSRVGRGGRGGRPEFPAAPAGDRCPFTTVSMSSRPDGWPPMRPGGLFVAIGGGRRDGHDFVADALANGAAAALVDHVPDDVSPSVAAGHVQVLHLSAATGWDLSRETVPTLAVVDPGTGTMATLQALGGWWRRRWGGPVVAIAGSVGKTTTKDLTVAVLSRQFRTLGTEGNLNNELGLPITLLRLTPEHAVAAVEIGISAPGEMAAFSAIASPDVAVMTRIEAEHLEFLHDIETVAREEGTLVERLAPSGTAVLNADDPRVLAMAGHTRARVVTYGHGPGAHVQARDVHSRGLDGASFQLWHDGRGDAVTLPLAGRHFIGAALAAAAAGLVLGVSRESVVAGLESMPVAPRVRVLRPDDALVVIDDTYNASPASCIAALDLLAEAPGAHVAILGDMLELGDSTAEAHRIVGAHVPGRATRLIAVGEASRGIAAAAITGGMAPGDVAWVPHAADAAGAFETWRRASGASTRFTVLVKGSRGMRMEQVTHDLGRRTAVDAAGVSTASTPHLAAGATGQGMGVGS